MKHTFWLILPNFSPFQQKVKLTFLQLDDMEV